MNYYHLLHRNVIITYSINLRTYTPNVPLQDNVNIVGYCSGSVIQNMSQRE